MLTGELIQATPAAAMINDQTVVGSLAATAPTVFAPAVGVAFTAPPSGQVSVGLSVDMGPPGSQTMIVGIRVYTGSVIGSGALVDGGEPADGANGGFIRVLSTGVRMSVGKAATISGLTVGSAYNAAFYYYVTGGSATVFHRGITVTPIL